MRKDTREVMRWLGGAGSVKLDYEIRETKYKDTMR